MSDGQLGTRTAAARCLRNVTACASKEIKSVVAHNGGAKACIDLLAEVCLRLLMLLTQFLFWALEVALMTHARLFIHVRKPF